MVKKPTIVDIALRLGITPSAVSKAFNDHPRISDQTKIAVLQVAKELDYRPNAMAKHEVKKHRLPRLLINQISVGKEKKIVSQQRVLAPQLILRESSAKKKLPHLVMKRYGTKSWMVSYGQYTAKRPVVRWASNKGLSRVLLPDNPLTLYAVVLDVIRCISNFFVARRTVIKS